MLYNSVHKLVECLSKSRGPPHGGRARHSVVEITSTHDEASREDSVGEVMNAGTAAPQRETDIEQPFPTPARCGIADPDSDFTFLRTRAVDLPDPEPLLINLTRSVIEVIAGARDLEQLSRWISEDVYRTLVKQASLAARARSVKRQQAMRPIVHVGSVHTQMPVDDVCEAVVMVQVGRTRARAVAIRLEGIDHRWRATSVGVL